MRFLKSFIDVILTLHNVSMIITILVCPSLEINLFEVLKKLQMKTRNSQGQNRFLIAMRFNTVLHVNNQIV